MTSLAAKPAISLSRIAIYARADPGRIRFT